MNGKKPQMTIAEVLSEIRATGVHITQRELSDGIAYGTYPFGEVLWEGPTGRRTFRIWRKNFEAWAREWL